MNASRRSWLTVVGVLLVLQGVGHAAEQVSQHPDRVAKRGKMIPITRVKPGTIKADGDLSDWGDLRDRAVAISQYFHWNYGHQQFGRRPDAALYKLMHDGDALYVAVRVVDNALVYVAKDESTERGDRVLLHIDVRPLSGPGPKLGDADYSDGVYLMNIAPPPKDGDAPRWEQHGPKVREIGPIEVTGRLMKGGYQIECRLPLTSLDPKAAPGRLSQPIGFEPYVRERDPDPSGKETSVECGYSWGNMRACFRYASRFACAHEAYEPELGLPFLQVLRARIPNSGTSLFFQTALITTIEEKDAGDMFELYHRFAATDFDRADDPEVPSVPSVQPADKAVTLPYPELGIGVHFRRLQLSKLAPGRYYIETEYPGPDISGKSVRYYARLSKGAVTAEIVRSPKDETDVLQEIVSRRPRLELDTHYATGKESVAGRLGVALPTWLWFDLSEQAERAAEAGETGRGPCSFRLQLMRPIWQKDLPLRANGAPLEIPSGTLDQGAYELRISAVHPDGAASAIAWAAPSTRFRVPKGKMMATARAPFVIGPPRETMIGTTVQDAAKLLTGPVKIGDPTRSRFPKDDMPDCQARSIHDLLLYDGRIYVGCGDWERNRGPIDVWSFPPAAEGKPETFIKEFTVDEEAVEVFREYGGKLYVPGIDGCHRTKQDWSLGNLYVKADGKWQKLRTVPRAVLVRDVAEFDGKLYVSTSTTSGGTLYESADGGTTWTRCGWDARVGRLERLLPLDGGLLVTTSDPKMYTYRYSGGKMEPLLIPLLPGCGRPPRTSIERLERFGRGAVYTAECEGGRWPLFYLEDLEQGAVLVEQFQDLMVNDIVVRDGKCYVLTGEHVGGKEPTCSGTIYVSSDLRSWTRLAAFTVPAMPNSVELANGIFYVGLANHQPWTSSDPESGTIWRIRAHGLIGRSSEAAAPPPSVDAAAIPAIAVELTDVGDPVPVGGATTYTVTATNQGSAPQTRIKVVATFEPGSQYVSSSGSTKGTVHGGDIVEFDILPRLAPGAQASWVVVLKAVKPGDTRFSVSLTSRQLRRPVRETEATTSYAVSSNTAAEPPAIPAIRLEMGDVRDPVPVGDTVTYVIAATNQGLATQTDIKMVARLWSHAQYVSCEGVAAGALRKIRGMDVVEFRPLPALAPKAKAIWQVTVRAAEPGDVRFLVSMTSGQLGRPVKEEESTTFYLRPAK